MFVMENTSSAPEKLSKTEGKVTIAAVVLAGAALLALPSVVSKAVSESTTTILGQKGEVNSDGPIDLKKGFRIIDEDLETIMEDSSPAPKTVGK